MLGIGGDRISLRKQVDAGRRGRAQVDRPTRLEINGFRPGRPDCGVPPGWVIARRYLTVNVAEQPASDAIATVVQISLALWGVIFCAAVKFSDLFSQLF